MNVDLLAVALGIVGAVWGFLADRISAQWPAHEDGSMRGGDWRTIVLIVFGAVALAAIPGRFSDLGQRLLFVALFGMFVLQMATDLDQRLLPNLLTVPVIVLGLLVLWWGGDSLVNRQPAWLAILVAIALPALLYLLSMPFGAGAFGEGDVMFLAGAGLFLGWIRLLIAVFVGTLLSGVVIALLLVTRRITLRSYVPLGPFLIIGTLWAALLPASS